jgi:hypothetical protein
MQYAKSDDKGVPTAYIGSTSESDFLFVCQKETFPAPSDCDLAQVKNADLERLGCSVDETSFDKL